MESSGQNSHFDFRKHAPLNFSRDSDRDCFSKKLGFFPLARRANGLSGSLSQRSDHRTVSPGSALNLKFLGSLREPNPAVSVKSFLGKRELFAANPVGFLGLKPVSKKLEPPRFDFDSAFGERSSKQWSHAPFPKLNALGQPQTLARLEPIAKIDFRRRFQAQFLPKHRSTKTLQFGSRLPRNQSPPDMRRAQPFRDSREHSASFRESNLVTFPRLHFADDRPRKVSPPKLCGNLLASMRPRLFPGGLAGGHRMSQLNFSNPNSRRLGNLNSSSRLNLSTNDRPVPKPLETIQGSEVTSRVSCARESRPSAQRRENQNDPNPSLKAYTVEPAARVQALNPKIKDELEKLVEEFRVDLQHYPDISEQEALLLLLVLKFLFDFDVCEHEFAQLDAESQSAFRKFLRDRYFKDETERSNRLELLYHDVVVKPDRETDARVRLEDLLGVDAEKSPSPKLRRQVQFTCVRIKKYRAGVLGVATPEFLADFSQSAANRELEVKTVQLSRAFLLEQAPRISLLQRYLRTREKLNLFCRRRKKMHRKSKRNDEKVKKIFKRIMKSLLTKYRAAHLSKPNRALSSAEREIAFYEHYFGHLPGGLEEFYDPLKRKLANPRFKSISTKYLAFLARSELFVADLRSFCASEMVPEVLGKYPENLMKRFRENPRFLEEMDRFKTKFEWIRHELQAAIFHFLAIFEGCLSRGSSDKAK